MEKERLDMLLLKRGLFESREKARSAIMAGIVFIGTEKVDKAGTMVAEDSDIQIKGNTNPYVSRGGLKLEKALSQFGISLSGKTTMDIGASTGGFTDCMLKNGAVKVFSVDVGYGQLAWELRNDPRVVCMERTNIRYVKPEDIGEQLDFATVDVSFISLKKVIPVARELLKPDGEMVCLVKPQFEAGREKVGKHGVVRDIQTHIEVYSSMAAFILELGFGIKGMTYSPIKGPEGNIEYLAYISKAGGETDTQKINEAVKSIVDNSHKELN